MKAFRRVSLIMIITVMAFTVFSYAEEGISVHAATKKSQSITAGNKTIEEGSVVKLGAKASSNLKLTYRSANPKTASIDKNGNIKGLRRGKTTITISQAGNSKYKPVTKTITVTVKTTLKYVAHRGYHNSRIRENTKAAFIAAGQRRFWGAECDIYETKHTRTGSFDIVIHHDDNFKRIYNNSTRVRKLTANQMRSKFPDITFFGEYLDICKKYKMVPIVEYKDEDMSPAAVRRSVDLLYQKGLLKSAYIQSFNVREMSIAYKYSVSKYKIAPKRIYLITTGNIHSDIDKAYRSGIRYVSIKKTGISKAVYNHCSRLNMTMASWTFYANKGNKVFNEDKVKLGYFVKHYNIKMAGVDGSFPRISY